MNRTYFFSFILIFILLTPALCAAVEDSSLPHALVFTVPSHQEGEPGEFVTYLFQIENQTNTEKTFTASAVSSQDWPLLVSVEHISIPAGGKGFFAVSVWIPAAAYGGTEDTLTVNFTGPEIANSYNLTTKALVTTKFSFTCPEKIAGQPGEIMKIPVTLINQGSTTRSFSFQATSEKRWRLNWETTGVTLAPGEEMTTRLQAIIPANAAAGSSDTIYLLVKTTDAEKAEEIIKEYRLSVLVQRTSRQPAERESRIPLYSNFSLALAPPQTPEDFFFWATTIGLSGEIHPLFRYNFFLSGEAGEDSFSPSALFLGLTGDKWYMQAGRFASGWPGLIDAPSTAANLYLQTRDVKPWSLWLGAGEEFISPAWLGGTIDQPEQNLRWSLLVPLEENRLHGVLETRYTPFRVRDWRWSYRHALGFDKSKLLNQGEFSLQRTELDWRFTAALAGGNNFHFEYEPDDESAYTGEYAAGFGAADLNLEYYYSPRLTLEPGLTFRVTTVNRQPRTSYTLQNRFSFPYSYFLLRRRQNLYGQTTKGIEVGFSNQWRQADARTYQGTAALSWDWRTPTDTVRLYGRLRRWFYAASYLEAAYEQRWEKNSTGLSTPFNLGLRWYHLLYSNWENYGSVYFRDPGTAPSFYTLQAATGYWFSSGTFLQLRANARWEETEAILAKIELYLFYRDLFFLSTPWGSIEGRVFLDQNRNGRFDPDEPGIPGVTILLDGTDARAHVKTTTNDTGYFRLPRLKKGEYLLSYFPEETDAFYLAPDVKQVTVHPNRVFSVNIPALPPLDLKGLVFLDKNRNNLPDPDEPPAGRIQLLLYPVDDGESPATVETNPDGSFFLTGLFPGVYRLEAVTETLPEFTIGDPVILTVEDSNPPLILFPLHEEEREIDFTFF